MSFLHSLKKKKIPDELPDLATDEIEEKIDDKKLEEHKDLVDSYLKEEEEKHEIPEKKTKKHEKKKKYDKIFDDANKKNPNLNLLPKVGRNSFFNNLQENITDEINDLKELEKWYNKKFLPRDIVNEMRSYWEGQKTNSVIRILGKNLQEKITEKINKLQELENDWQNIYFDLIEKEEEIKENEAELKKILAEFIELCKRKQEEENE